MNIIQSISLKNFRSHEKFVLKCDKPTTLIIGENGSGKTSILEAIYLCLRGKSFKGVDDEMVKRGEDYYRVALDYCDGENIVVTYTGAREFSVGDKKTRRLPLRNRYPVILFEPDDLYLVGSSPFRRRAYFDKLLGQIEKNYNSVLIKYNKALRQRNDLLKNISIARDRMFSWDVILAKYGVLLEERREWLVGKINESLTSIYRDIAKNEDVCEMSLIKTNGKESEYLAALTKCFEKDKCVGYTTFGAHLNDYVFWFNGKPADGSASRGEIRSMVLALKFIEAQIIREETNKLPVVLLDDIFSELDETRQKHVMVNFKDYQVIISGTNVPKEMGDGVIL